MDKKERKQLSPEALEKLALAREKALQTRLRNKVLREQTPVELIRMTMKRKLLNPKNLKKNLIDLKLLYLMIVQVVMMTIHQSYTLELKKRINQNLNR